MFIHRENALKALHYHISYCSIQRDHFKKTILTQNLIKIFTKTHQIVPFKKYSRGRAYPQTLLAGRGALRDTSPKRDVYIHPNIIPLPHV